MLVMLEMADVVAVHGIHFAKVSRFGRRMAYEQPSINLKELMTAPPINEELMKC
jgi:hypothetical protein